MSILSALKAKGAKGKNIEEAVKTLPAGGGGDGSVLVVGINIENNVETLDKTWQQIHDATLAVTRATKDDMSNMSLVDTIAIMDGNYIIHSGKATYSAVSPDNYPSNAGR